MQKREKATDHVTGNGAVQVCGTREEGDAVYTLTLERAGLVELHRGASICQYTTAMFLCYDSPDPRCGQQVMPPFTLCWNSRLRSQTLPELHKGGLLSI